MADDNNAQNNNVVPAQVQPANNAPARQWVTNPMVGNYYPETRQGKETFHQKTRGLPEDKRCSVLQKKASALKNYSKK